jgi:hypothetical protein
MSSVILENVLLNRYKHLIGHLNGAVCPNKCGALEAVIILPTTAKEELFKRYSFLKNIRQEMIASISSAERLIIGGYSLPETDIDFREILKNGVEQNSDLKEIVLINPECVNDDFVDRFKSVLDADRLLGRCCSCYEYVKDG